MLSTGANNWFYMDRKSFRKVLTDELGSLLTKRLLEIDFDTAISFMIGETAEEVLIKIQQSLSRLFCNKIICNAYCTSCALMPSSYAKLTWFVQRLLIMSPISKPFVQRTFPLKTTNSVNGKNSTEPSFMEKINQVYSFLLRFNE
jgi:hypothetical protein